MGAHRIEAVGAEARDEPEWVGDDVVGSDPPDPGPFSRWWSAVSPARRRVALLALAVVVAAACVAWGVEARRSWVADRALDDEVTLSASMGVSSSSTTPAGGSVDFYVSIVNLGPRPVTITAVDITTGRFQITNGEIRLPTIQPDRSLLVPLSVLLDCTGTPDDAGEALLPGTVGAVPASGRGRDVAVEVAAADLVTGIAATLCRIRPDLQDLELDGPVL